MTKSEFDNRIRALFPEQELDDAAFSKWHQYAGELDADEAIETTKSEFYLDMYAEFATVAKYDGSDIARQLFNLGSTFTLNPFEVRRAAELLREGVALSEIGNYARENDLFFSDEQFWQSSEVKKAYLSQALSEPEML